MQNMMASVSMRRSASCENGAAPTPMEPTPASARYLSAKKKLTNMTAVQMPISTYGQTQGPEAGTRRRAEISPRANKS